MKGADFIPVGATLQMDGIRCRIDAVDFAANEVRLTNIEDKNRPIRFSENISYVRSFVEDAGIAIYDAIREKLKASQKAQPSQPQKVQKLKGKDMEL